MMRLLTTTAIALLLFTCVSYGQSTSFSYQGRLDSGGNPASGNHDFEFVLFDELTGGTQVGTTVSQTDVNVAEGLFSVLLDFGNQFPGDARYLEIRVRQSGQGAFTTLSPRQPLASIPYAIKSANAANAERLGGVNSSLYVLTTDPRMTDARNPVPNSPDYVQNRTTTQTSSNFNISGNGFAGGRLTGNSIDSQTEYFLGGNRILATPGSNNLYLGFNSASGFFSGTDNSYFGDSAGRFTTTGSNNSNFGSSAGTNNQSGSDNSFFGSRSGSENIDGNRNSFFGKDSGRQNIGGDDNSFFGYGAGFQNTGGNNNTFFGSKAGNMNLNASDNSFFGAHAGLVNTTGQRNSFFGRDAGRTNDNGNDNSFFGAGSGRWNFSGSNNSFFGGFSGESNVSGSLNSFFGYDSGKMNDSGNSNAFFGNSAGFGNISGSFNAFFGVDTGRSNTTGNDNSFFGSAAGAANTGGVNNSFFGTNAGRFNIGGSDNSFFGKDAGRFNSNGSVNVFVGSRAGYNVTSGGANTFVGNDAGGETSTGVSNSFFGRDAGDSNTTGGNNSTFGRGSDVGGGALSFATAIGSNAVVTTSNTVQLGRNGQDIVRIGTLGPGGATSLCINGGNDIASCSSSARYKSEIRPFVPGLELVRRLRPVSFRWTDGGMLDMGLVAEEVAEVEPLLTTTRGGEVEGVKYDRVGVVLVNAVQEQQAQIEKQQIQLDQQTETIRKQLDQIEQMNLRLRLLEQTICKLNPSLGDCAKTRDQDQREESKELDK